MSEQTNLNMSLSVPPETVVAALTELGPDSFVALIKDVDAMLADWSLISSLKPWVDAEHRQMILEETEEKSEQTGKCTRSAEYEDIWVHTNPHKGCILR